MKTEYSFKDTHIEISIKDDRDKRVLDLIIYLDSLLSELGLNILPMLLGGKIDK